MATPLHTLDDLIAFHQQLELLALAGVPCQLGLPAKSNELTNLLQRINAAVALRMSHGATLVAALAADDPAIPANYRNIMVASVRAGELPLDFKGEFDTSCSFVHSESTPRSALFYPMLLIAVAYAGLVAACLYLYPVLDNFYAGLEVVPGTGLALLRVLRETLPVWSIAMPVAWLLLMIWNWRTRSSLRSLSSPPLRWLPGVREASEYRRNASIASALAALLRSGVPIAEAWPLATKSADPLPTQPQTSPNATPSGATPVGATPVGATPACPPFLRWALHESGTMDESGRSPDRVAALQMAADLYRQGAEYREDQLRRIGPIVVSIGLGGLITLFYGLCLFLPVTQLLTRLGD